MSARQGCTTCSRVMLVLLNIAMLLAGLALIGLVLWVRFDERIEQDIRRNIDPPRPIQFDLDNVKTQIRLAITVSFWVLIGFGAAGAVLGLIGICGSVAYSRCLTGFYLTLLIIAVLLEIAVGVFIIVYRPTIRDTVGRYVVLSNQYSQSDAQVLSYKYSCCGDSTNNQYNQQCRVNSQFGMKPCDAAAWDVLDFRLMVAGLIELGIVLLQILAVLFAFVVACSNRYQTLSETT